MADEVHPPAKKRRKTEKTSLHQKEEADKQQQSINQTGEIRKITNVRLIEWSISSNA